MNQEEGQVMFSQLRDFTKKWATEFAAVNDALAPSQVEDFVGLMMAETTGQEPPPDEALQAHLGYRIAEARCKMLGLEYTKYALIWLTCICETPGMIVMYVSAFKGAGIPLKMDTYANLFPNGTVNKEHARLMWDKQKGLAAGFACDNVLDTLRADIWEIL